MRDRPDGRDAALSVGAVSRGPQHLADADRQEDSEKHDCRSEKEESQHDNDDRKGDGDDPSGQALRRELDMDGFLDVDHPRMGRWDFLDLRQLFFQGRQRLEMKIPCRA